MDLEQKPLEDITVIDVSSGVGAPYGTALLSDFGAEVIMVERPGGAPQRRLFRGSTIPNNERNKHSIVIDLKNDSSKEIMTELVKSADVFVHNFTPSSMEKLGYTYPAIKELNEQIIYCSLTAYGEEGKYKDRRGTDPLIQAMSGILSVTGEPDRKPSLIGASPHDHGTGMFLAFAVMVALWHRKETGRGQKIETSLFDTAAAYMSYWYTNYDKTGETPGRVGDARNGYAPAGVYNTKDKQVYIACSRQSIWERLCQALGTEEWLTDPRFEDVESRVENRAILDEKVESITSGYERSELIEMLLENNVTITEVQTIPEVVDDDHLWDRGTLTTVEDTDGEDVVAVNTPIKFSESSPGIERGPPKSGEHTGQILSALGFTAEDIAAFEQQGVISSNE